jgi:hypothetical protein
VRIRLVLCFMFPPNPASSADLAAAFLPSSRPQPSPKIELIGKGNSLRHGAVAPACQPVRVHHVAGPPMPLLNFLELLPLPQMFAACLACGALVLFIVTLGVWIALRVLRVPPTRILFDSGILITVLSLMFAVLIGFASAGIWNDEVQARAAVQREANAIENIVALASSYPTELREQIHVEMMRYARNVLDRDWPAMQQRTDANDNLYDRSNSPLVAPGNADFDQGCRRNPAASAVRGADRTNSRSAKRAFATRNDCAQRDLCAPMAGPNADRDRSFDRDHPLTEPGISGARADGGNLCLRGVLGILCYCRPRSPVRWRNRDQANSDRTGHEPYPGRHRQSVACIGASREYGALRPVRFRQLLQRRGARQSLPR